MSPPSSAPPRRRATTAAPPPPSSSSSALAVAIASLAASAAGRVGTSAAAGWVDPDTPPNARTTMSLVDGSEYRLVMSDEFNVPNRTFADGHDPIWTALDKPDSDYSSAGVGSLQFYSSSTVTTTEDGYLRIGSELGRTEWDSYYSKKREWRREVRHYRSGMVQSWEKFCFTGGIVEVDVVLPGDPRIGGLWPAVWMLGNLGRATYEASTNNIWPWSYDRCDRGLQEAQALSACNRRNHYGLNQFQGRGATEIDIIEGMMGRSDGPLPSTDPPVSIPYADMTLQVAPGVPSNRPQPGGQPLRNNTLTASGHTELLAQTWYEGLEVSGNTTPNPYFYGTYLGETTEEEPVTRTEAQAFQADAVGAMYQLTPDHFREVHTFRLEWQPGPGGRLDWFARKRGTGGGDGGNESGGPDDDGDGESESESESGGDDDGGGERGGDDDGGGERGGDDDDDDGWVHAYSIRDESLRSLMGSQIPAEPSYIIMNTAISSTWGFPYDTPDWCERCYDCLDVTCACAFYPGFCNMMRRGDVAMLVDSVRVYQSPDGRAHPGSNHTLGCDPPEYPTREFIRGHEYRYMRDPPFSYSDAGPIKYEIQRGGERCSDDADCGGGGGPADDDPDAAGGDPSDGGGAGTAPTPTRDSAGSGPDRGAPSSSSDAAPPRRGRRGRCVARDFATGLFRHASLSEVRTCECESGYAGPRCLAVDRTDDSPSAYRTKGDASLMAGVAPPRVTPFMAVSATVLLLALGTTCCRTVEN